MIPGTQVTKTVTLPDTRRLRYQTFERNQDTPPLTYKKQGRVMRVVRGDALIHWANGLRSWEKINTLEEI